MRLLIMYRATAIILLATACAGSAQDASCKHVARTLSNALGEAADPQIGFQRDSTHLLVLLLTVAFPTVSEAELTMQARRIATTALHNYDEADQLDSVTVVYQEPVRQGMWWIRHTRKFAVAELSDSSRALDASLSPSPNTR